MIDNILERERSVTFMKDSFTVENVLRLERSISLYHYLLWYILKRMSCDVSVNASFTVVIDVNLGRSIDISWSIIIYLIIQEWVNYRMNMNQ